MPYNLNILFLGKSVDLTEYEAEAVTSLIKLYIRELPENILTSALLPKFNEISGKKKKDMHLHSGYDESQTDISAFEGQLWQTNSG